MRNHPTMNSVFFCSEARGSQETCWSPRADIYRSADGWLIKFDLAGVQPDDVAISCDGPLLSVSGIRRDLFVEEGYHSYSIEISYSYFERRIRLTDEIRLARTEYRDGMLLVKLTT